MFTNQAATTMQRTTFESTDAANSVFDDSHFVPYAEWYTNKYGSEPSSSLAIFLAPPPASLADAASQPQHDDEAFFNSLAPIAPSDEQLDFDYFDELEASTMELVGLVKIVSSLESEMDEDRVDQPDIDWMDDKDEMELDLPEIVWMDYKDEIEVDLPEIDWMIVDGDEMEVDGP